ncbi:MAG: SDR family oxidoreductase [Propionicimonas sp.]
MTPRRGEAGFDYSGGQVVVTGAGRGIGRALAAAFADAGAHVVGVTRSAASADELRSETGFTVVQTDIVADSAPETIHRAVRGNGLPLLGLINNAGEVVTRAPAVEWGKEAWQRALDVNLTAVFALSAELFEPLREAGGAVVNVASVLSFTGGLNSVGYAASKGGVAQLTKALSNEWAPLGVRVNAIAPGYVATDANATLRDPANPRAAAITARIPMHRWAAPDDMCGPVLFLCSDAARYLTGVVLPVDGGFLSW